MPLTMTLNGESRTFPDLRPGSTLNHLVEVLQLKPDRVAIERNGEIAARTEWQTLELQPGDRVELVHFVGGGTL